MDNASVPSLPWPDTVAILGLSRYFDRTHHQAGLREADALKLTDLKIGPVIFLGGIQNPWTSDYLSHMRFHIQADPGKAIISIIDNRTAAPAVQIDQTTPYLAAQEDYALVSRFMDPATGNYVMQLSGLGAHGTASAAEFVLNPRYMNALDRNLFTCGTNLQFIIETQVAEGSAGVPKLIAHECW
jgi:hypothetical protein